MNQQALQKVLYVDDEIINLELFELMFGGEFDITLAESGPAALEYLRENKPVHLIISDMKMPHMTGFEFIHRVKDLNRTIPCIILSGYQETEQVRDAIDSGIIVDFVLKPFNKKEFRSLMLKSLAH